MLFFTIVTYSLFTNLSADTYPPLVLDLDLVWRTSNLYLTVYYTQTQPHTHTHIGHIKAVLTASDEMGKFT